MQYILYLRTSKLDAAQTRYPKIFNRSSYAYTMPHVDMIAYDAPSDRVSAEDLTALILEFGDAFEYSLWNSGIWKTSRPVS